MFAGKQQRCRTFLWTGRTSQITATLRFDFTKIQIGGKDTFEEMTMQYIDYMPRKIAKENDAYFEEEENSLLACMQKGEKHG